MKPKLHEPYRETRPLRYDRNVLPYRKPFKGWKFVEKGNVIIPGSNHKDLVRNLIQYRVKNGMTVGNPNYEVEQYICRKNLHLAEFGESQYKDVAPIDVFKQYLKEAKICNGRKVQAVIEHERSIACEKCECNQVLRKSKGYENEALLIAGEVERGDLLQCSEHIWDNMIAVKFEDNHCGKWKS